MRVLRACSADVCRYIVIHYRTMFVPKSITFCVSVCVLGVRPADAFVSSVCMRACVRASIYTHTATYSPKDKKNHFDQSPAQKVELKNRSLFHPIFLRARPHTHGGIAHTHAHVYIWRLGLGV